MVFLNGPRQVGKTTLALALLGTTSARHPAYLSWDDVQARPRIVRGEMLIRLRVLPGRPAQQRDHCG